MAGTFTITFRSFTVPPGSAINVRSAPDWATAPGAPCTYHEDSRQWVATLPAPDPPTQFEFKFVLGNGPDDPWQFGENLILEQEDLADPAACTFDDRTVRFFEPNRLLVDFPAPAQRFFDRQYDRADHYDAIIVGSGAGGGTLAYKLAELPHNGTKRSVLVLEAGSYLFPLHAGDLPRRPLSGPNVDKGVWDLWWYYRVTRYPPAPDLSFGEGLNFGGKASFWGALAPKMMPWEFADWPSDVATDLQQRWYAQAEQLTRVEPATAPSPYQNKVRNALAGIVALKDYQHVDAPIAAGYAGPAPASLAAGIFSTAELLIERKLEKTGNEYVYGNLKVQLNAEVLSVNTAGTAASEVVAWDHATGRERRYQLTEGGVVVLAAGTLGTPVIAGASNLTVNTDLLGRGLTDHAIYTVPFAIDAGTKDWFSGSDSALTLSRYADEPVGPDGRPAHPYDAKLELNTNLSLSRYTDRAAFLALAGNGRMPCELVFMLESPLLDANIVRGEPSKAGMLTQLRLTAAPAPITAGVKDEMDAFADAVLGAFGGLGGARMIAPIGAVGHEVGTMRMARTTAQGGDRPGLVDSDLRVLGLDNLYVCDLSAFPSSPAANPTLTLVALALRLAEHLGQS